MRISCSFTFCSSPRIGYLNEFKIFFITVSHFLLTMYNWAWNFNEHCKKEASLRSVRSILLLYRHLQITFDSVGDIDKSSIEGRNNSNEILYHLFPIDGAQNSSKLIYNTRIWINTLAYKIYIRINLYIYCIYKWYNVCMYAL